MSRRIVAALLPALLLLAAPGCEMPDPEAELDARIAEIIGGEVDEDDEYLPVVAIYFFITVWEGGLCSGTIVNDEWILTAAHCPVDGFAMGSSRVYVGHDMNAGDVTKLEFDEVEIHPDYGYDYGVPFNDVAVIHLAEPSPVEGIPIQRDELTDDLIGEELTYVGFGVTSNDPDAQVDGLKRHVDIEVADVYPFDFDVLYYESASTGTAHGDSGGPALYDFGDGPRVVGVTSWGGGQYGVSMAVDKMADWIDGHTGGDSAPWDDDDAGDDDDSAADDDDGDDDSAGGDDDGEGCECRSGPGGTTAAGLPLGLLLALLALRRFRP